MIPECSRVRRRELVHELLAWSDRRLGEARHAIHGVRQSDAVPTSCPARIQKKISLSPDGAIEENRGHATSPQ
jgi:hypothetical protein